MQPPVAAVAALACIVLTHCWALAAAAAPSSSSSCVDVVNAFVDAENQRLHRRPPAPPSPSPTVFHLHIPRTAGRTFHGCLLTAAVTPGDRCPRAYGPGGGDAAAAGAACALLASHDDASLLPSLASGTLVAVQVRHPLERVLSSYEFATESAALAASGAAAKRPRHGRGGGGALGPPTPVATVWPWSHLVPWLKGVMGEEGEGGTCEGGRGARCAAATTAAAGPRPLAPLSLAEFIAAPLTADLVHNGATLQVLGATNASRAPDAARVRSCVRSDAAAAAAAATAAAARLREWVAAGGHVGVSERLDASVEAATVAFGWSLAAPLPRPSNNASSPPRTLGQAYRDCEARTRDRSARRRARAAAALGGAPPLGREGRAALPDDVRDAILAANAADVALHAVAGELLDAVVKRGGGGRARLPPLRARGRQDRSEL